MHGRHVKVIIDTNLWISFLIGLNSSPAIRSILTDGTVEIVIYRPDAVIRKMIIC